MSWIGRQSWGFHNVSKFQYGGNDEAIWKWGGSTGNEAVGGLGCEGVIHHRICGWKTRVTRERPNRGVSSHDAKPSNMDPARARARGGGRQAGTGSRNEVTPSKVDDIITDNGEELTETPLLIVLVLPGILLY